MTQPIDTAYVDIVARDASLKKLRKDIDNTFDKIDKDIDQDLKTIDDHFAELFDKIDDRFHDLERSVDGVFQEIIDGSSDSSIEIDKNFARAETNVRRHFKKIANEAKETFDDIDHKFVSPLRKGMLKLGEIVGETGRVIGQIGSGIGNFVSSSPLLALIIVLAPAIIALAAALSQLIGVVGLIPAGFAVMLTAIIPVIVAFQNFGDAVSALASGDIDKINEALKKLSPSAAAVAREIAGLLPQLRALQRGVQESFFKQISGDFSALLRNIFPTMEKGFIDVAAAVGRLVSSFTELLGSTRTIQVFQELFAKTVLIIDRLSPAFTVFADMLLNTVHEALPTVERLANAFAVALEKFSAFVNKSIETGDFDKFIDDAIVTIKELLALLGALGALVGTLFAGTEDSGHDFIKTLTDMTNKLNEFLKTTEGQRTIDLLVFAVQALGVILMTTAQTLIFFTNTFFHTLDFLEMVGRGFVAVMSTIIDWVVMAKDEVVQSFNNMVMIITNLPEVIMALGPKFLDAGKNLIQSFMNGFRAVGSFIGDVAGDIVGSVKGFLNKAIDKINTGISAIDVVLPGTLPRIPRLAGGAFVPRRPGGILANVGEGREDEWVLPDSKLQDVANSGGQTITFGPGAINVNFTGAVPTAQEARDAGVAVGQGIIDMMTKRNMRVQVRAV